MIYKLMFKYKLLYDVLMLCAMIADRFGAVHGKLDTKWSNSSGAGTDCECEFVKSD